MNKLLTVFILLTAFAILSGAMLVSAAQTRVVSFDGTNFQNCLAESAAAPQTQAECCDTLPPGFSVVTGRVFDDNHLPVNGVSVTISCSHGGYTYTRNATTNVYGRYYVIYYGTNCANGDVVTITASKDGQSGSGTGTMIGWLENNCNWGGVNISIVSVKIPEFGLFAGGAAVIAAIGIFLLVRTPE